MALSHLMTPKSAVEMQGHEDASHSEAGEGRSLQCITLWCASPTPLHIWEAFTLLPLSPLKRLPFPSSNMGNSELLPSGDRK